MLTWLIRSARTEQGVFSSVGHRSSVENAIDAIASGYELSPARAASSPSSRRGRSRARRVRSASRSRRCRSTSARSRRSSTDGCSSACRAALRSRRRAGRCCPRPAPRSAPSSAAAGVRARRSRSRPESSRSRPCSRWRSACCRATSSVWHERYPDVGIRLHEFRHRSLLEDAVEQGVADFAIGPLPVRRLGGAARRARVGGVRRRRAAGRSPRAARVDRARGARRPRMGALPPGPRARRDPRGDLPARRLQPARLGANVAGRRVRHGSRRPGSGRRSCRTTSCCPGIEGRCCA